jgi:probable HAF family extracellular repeat protein
MIQHHFLNACGSSEQTAPQKSAWSQRRGSAARWENRFSRGWAVIVGGLLLPAGAWAQFSFVVTDLGIPGGGSSSAANAINNAGQIVGTSNNSPLFPAWIYSNGSATVVAANASAYGVGPAGQVLGSGANNHAYVYANGTTTDLGTLGGFASTAVAMNAAGQIVGTSFTAGFQNHAFSYANGTMSDLGTLGGTSSFAGGINAAGTIVGVSRTAGGVPHAFAYANGVMTDLGTLGGTESHGNGINDVGQIVGYSMITGGQTRAFLWANGTMTNLGALGGTDSYGYGINAAGQIVGELVLSGGVSHAMYYMGGQMYDLNALTNLSGSGLTRLDWATAINDSGQIVGIGTATDGSQHGFLLTAIPEPSTYAALAGLGALGLAVGVRGRRRQ